MKKNLKKYIPIFLLIFLILSIFGVLQVISKDLIWTYGFSYNISNGLLPYKDFNMVISPLYSIVFSLPLMIFGNSMLTFKLFHILIYTLILTLIYTKINKRVFILVLMIIIQDTTFWYNTFSTVLLLLILYLIDSNIKYKNIYIGLIIGFIIMTKQNIGLPLLLVYLITSKNKLQSILSAAVPIGITLIILLINGSILQYINFCYLGMGNFIGNLYFDFFILLSSIVIIVLLLLKYQKEKDIKILYILAFMTIIFPIIETNHFKIILIPITYYVLIKNDNIIAKYSIIIFASFGLIVNILSLQKTELFLDNSFLKYNNSYKGVNHYLQTISSYINKLDGDKYLLLSDAYLIKLYNNENPSFYDLINKGNLGSNEEKYIKQMAKNCENKKCVFILDGAFFEKKEKMNQFQLISNFKNYVVNNYKYIETLPTNDRVYKNN